MLGLATYIGVDAHDKIHEVTVDEDVNVLFQNVDPTDFTPFTHVEFQPGIQSWILAPLGDQVHDFTVQVGVVKAGV